MQGQMEWISVKDGLPETKLDENVLVYTTSGVVISRLVKEYGNFVWQLPWGNFTEDVTHWMPLPKPPQDAHSY